MSEENVERVRKGFEAHNRGDLDALVEFYDPDVVFETLLLGTHHGNEAIRLIYEENQKTLSGYDVVRGRGSAEVALGRKRSFRCASKVEVPERAQVCGVLRFRASP
jgi:hypothetical protein